MTERTNKVVIVVGGRGTGKTSYVKEVMMASSLKRRIVMDTLDRSVWRNMKTWNKPEWGDIPLPILNKADLQKNDDGFYRIIPANPELAIAAMLKTVTNSLIVFEDAARYIEDKLDRNTNSLVIDTKQAGCDAIFVFHALSEVPNRLARKADFLTLFETQETFDHSIRKKFPSPSVAKAFEKIQKEKPKDPFVKVTVAIGG